MPARTVSNFQTAFSVFDIIFVGIDLTLIIGGIIRAHVEFHRIQIINRIETVRQPRDILFLRSVIGGLIVFFACAHADKNGKKQ